ncbi:hypothetical protein BGZ92_000653 [Podila epicladia]|nr:hypothetical protein BGZ92_000653 [Podila epicladia]
MSISSYLAWAMAALLIFSPSLTLSVLAQDTPTSITLTFYTDAGEPIEAATQTILRATCVDFNTALFVDGYASVVASEPHAALNLYPGPYCTFLSKSTVGFWNNTDAVLNTLSVRYEGLAPDTAPGTLSDTAFPPNMYVQPKIPDPEGNGKGANPADWVLDPEKGKIVIILVAAVLGVGVSIGLYAVYQAAQYKPPPKKKKEKKFKGLQTKKVKKKDAYYLKPVKEANKTAPLLSNMTPLGTPDHSTNKTLKSTALVSSSITTSFSPPVSRGSMQERRTQEASVLIDMQETNLGSKSSSNTISSGRTMTSINSPNSSPPRRGPGGQGPGPVSATNIGVKPSTITASSSASPPPPKSSGTPLNVSAPSTPSPLVPSSSPDLIQFTPPMTQLYQLRPQPQQQQQQPQQQRSSFQPQPYQQYPPPPSLQTQHPRPGFPQLQQRPQRPQIISQYQPPPMNSPNPPTSPTGSGGFGVPRGGYGQRPPQSYQGQQGRSMSPPARAMSPPTR